MNDTPSREIFLQAELEEHIRERAPEFLARAVASAAKPCFAVEYKGRPAWEDRDCYNCEYCHRLRYLKGEWHCRITKPHEVPNPLTCFVHRSEKPDCFSCESWCPNDPRCMNPRSQWAGKFTSPDNYCRFFERRPPEP